MLFLAFLILVRCGKDSPVKPQQPRPVPARITITPQSPALSKIGQMSTLNAVVLDENGAEIADPGVSWSSDNTAVASVSSSGVVTARRYGNARISATLGSVSAGVTVSVVSSSARIAISPPMVSLPAIGQTAQLSVKVHDGNRDLASRTSVVWTSSDPALATVSPSGMVTAQGRGTVKITATYGSVSATVGVSVMTSDLDKAVLIALYNATNGPNWTNNDNWLSEAPVGDWHGVETDGDDRVVELRLTQNNLEGPIPAELGSLDRLEALDFWNNRLNGTIPPELGQLSDLGTLWLAGNELTGSIPPELGKLKNLWQMSLAGNQLSGNIPGALGRAAGLSTLFLSNNALSGPIPSEFGQLKNLWELYINNNRLSGEIPSALGQLTRLTHLLLSNNPDLSGALPSTFANLPLVTLRLGGTSICAPLTTEIQAWLQSIREKDVDDCADPDRDALIAMYNGTGGRNWTNSTNWLSYEPLSAWYGVTTDSNSRVTALNLENNNLLGPLPAELSRLTELSTLNLSSNAALYGSLPHQFTDLNLQSLILNGTNLCSPSDESFKSWLREIPNKDVAECNDSNPEWSALVALYFSTNGPNWTNDSNWLSEAPLGDWARRDGQFHRPSDRDRPKRQQPEWVGAGWSERPRKSSKLESVR